MLLTNAPLLLQVAIIIYVVIEIWFVIGSITPATFLANLVLFFLLRIAIALFVNLPVSLVLPAGFTMLPSGLPWATMNPFNGFTAPGVSIVTNTTTLVGGRQLADSDAAAGTGTLYHFDSYAQEAVAFSHALDA